MSLIVLVISLLMLAAISLLCILLVSTMERSHELDLAMTEFTALVDEVNGASWVRTMTREEIHAAPTEEFVLVTA